MVGASPPPSLRIDKWLWQARIFKTRTLATKFTVSGKIRLNKARISKASHLVQTGDTLTFMLNDRLRVLEIASIGTRRGPASEAQGIYIDHSPPPVDKSTPEGSQASLAQRDPGAGRPTKKQRRDLDRLRQSD
jgi:ribosome-associated heat shock protein Hsp15